MKIHRGDVVLIEWPFVEGGTTKLRPGVVVQNDRDNARLSSTIVAMITSRTFLAPEATQLPIDVSSPEAQRTGLNKPSTVNCANLFTVEQSRLSEKIGSLTAELVKRLDLCLAAAVGLRRNW